ncbi:uncharacterized protein LOC129577824 [Sitodiplosis mosellana]|uniref:uncharacterized protein LOC129577824 n=1 Tax=Sitodiplosis mosellana TaxID=263140 RepID=UPI0024449B8D|nr:uncharacterized protein LOC129577824 [Sitodiplosis mosellana]
MQEMDIEEDIYDFLPSVLRKYIIHYCRIYTNAKTFADFILTGGRDAVLYEVNGKNILSSLHLNDTIFKDIPLPESASENDTLNISLNAYYSYKKKQKEQYLFLRINDGLTVLGKVDKQLKIHREFQNISDYNIIDENGSGEASVEIVYVNGPPEKYELVSFGYASKGIDLRLTSEGDKYFKTLTQELEERVKQASSNLADININIRKEIDAYQKYCQTVEPNSNENINILSRYGDCWIRNVNGQVLIGIPVYNCSTSKNLVERIRVSVFASHRPQLVYTQKLYAFQTENAGIEPLKLHEICELDAAAAAADDDNEQLQFDGEQSEVADDKQTELVFNHEWIHQKQYTVYPDKAAIIIIKMELNDFEVTSNGCDYDIFLMYKVFLESGLWKEFQTHIANVKIDSDIFHDKRFFVSFDTNNIFRDLLAVIASSERHMFRIKFSDDTLMSCLTEFLTRRLLFDNISTELSVDDDYHQFTLSQNLDRTSSMSHFEEDHQMFYCPQDGYWFNTLIRIRDANDIENVGSSVAYDMKVYNRDEIKIKNLISTFGNEFGRKISIEPVKCANQSLLEMELRYKLRDEHNALDELARHIKYKSNQVQKCYNKFIDSQYRTDIAWSDLIEKSE